MSQQAAQIEAQKSRIICLEKEVELKRLQLCAESASRVSMSDTIDSLRNHISAQQHQLQELEGTLKPKDDLLRANKEAMEAQAKNIETKDRQLEKQGAENKRTRAELMRMRKEAGRLHFDSALQGGQLSEQAQELAVLRDAYKQYIEIKSAMSKSAEDLAGRLNALKPHGS